MLCSRVEQFFKTIYTVPIFTQGEQGAGSRDESVVRALCQMWVEFVVGSRLVLRVFLRVLGFSLLHKDQHLQIPFSPGLWTCVKTSKADVASSLNIVNFFINFLEITEKHLQVETLRKRIFLAPNGSRTHGFQNTCWTLYELWETRVERSHIVSSYMCDMCVLSEYLLDSLTTELWETRSERSHILGSYMCQVSCYTALRLNMLK